MCGLLSMSIKVLKYGKSSSFTVLLKGLIVIEIKNAEIVTDETIMIGKVQRQSKGLNMS